MSRRKYVYRKYWDELLEMYGILCVYCHQVPATQIDHVIPVSYIEYHGIENLRPSCGWCNLLAGSQVFEDFEAKYNWLRDRRANKRKNHHRRTFCTDCWVPFQYPLHSPVLFQCAECYDIDNHTAYHKKKVWAAWLELLDEAQIEIEIYRAFGDQMRIMRGKIIHPGARGRLFAKVQQDWMERHGLLLDD